MCKELFEKYRESFKNRDMVLFLVFSFLTLVNSVVLIVYSYDCPHDFMIFSQGMAIIFIFQGIIGLMVGRGIKKIIVIRENCWIFWNYFLLLLIDSAVGTYGFISIMPWIGPKDWEKPIGILFVISYITNSVCYYLFARIYYSHRPESSSSKFLLVKGNL